MDLGQGVRRKVIGLWNTRNAVHVEIEIVKLNVIWIWGRNVNRDDDFVAFVILHFDWLVFCDISD